MLDIKTDVEEVIADLQKQIERLDSLLADDDNDGTLKIAIAQLSDCVYNLNDGLENAENDE